jgi:glycosyltransferase involved in cell wall biosynthesis
MFLYPTLEVGGAERQVEALVTALDRARFRPIVAVQHASGRIGADLGAAGVPAHVLSDERRFHAAFFSRALKLMRHEGVRLVMTHGFSTGVVARLAGLLGGVPVRVLVEHTLEERDMNPVKHMLNRVLAPLATAWVAVTTAQLSYLTAVKRIPESRLHVIENGIDVTRYGNRKAEARARVRGELGIAETAPLAGCVAVLRPEKDLTTLVRAAEHVVKAMHEARFVIVGEGPERLALRREIVSRGLEGVVTLSGFRDDIADVLSAFDVSVLSSSVEALPVAFLESMATGLPLVGTHVGALVELIQPERNGLLVPPHEPQMLGEALLRVLGDLETARRWGVESRRQVAERFGLDRTVRAYEQLFTKLLTEAGVEVPASSRRGEGP